MRHVRLLTAAAVMGLLAACSSPQEDAARAQEGAFEAQEKVAKQRLEVVEKSQACVDEAAGDQLKVDACDSYLKAAEAMK